MSVLSKSAPQRKFVRIASLFAAIAFSASACNSGSAGGAPAGAASEATGNTRNDGSNSNSGNPDGGDGSGNDLIGESCVSSDPDKICLAIDFVAYQNSSGGVVATKEQAATISRTMNQLFAPCNIGFQIETYEAEDPAQYGLAYGSQSQSQVDQIRRTFTRSNDKLLSVTTGPWGTSVNAWTNMPGSGVYGAVMEASIVGYGGGIIYAHEFGHYLGLDHVSDSSDLMNPIISTGSTKLTSGQCQVARQTAQSYWSAMLRN